MNTEDANSWQDHVLDEVTEALAADEGARDRFIFKGARILALRLDGRARQSLDLDCCFRECPSSLGQSHEVMKAELNEIVTRALRRHFSGQDVIRFECESVKVRKKPPKRNHPAGLDGYAIDVRVRDLARPVVKMLPSLRVSTSLDGRGSCSQRRIRGCGRPRARVDSSHG